MTNKSTFIPFGILTREFYCHRCGNKLFRHSRTRVVHPKDPDYMKYAIHRRGLSITFFPGNVEVTEYDFRCPECETIIHYDKQLVIEQIQNDLGKRCLAESEIPSQESPSPAQDAVDQRERLRKILFGIVMLALFLIVLYLSK